MSPATGPAHCSSFTSLRRPPPLFGVNLCVCVNGQKLVFSVSEERGRLRQVPDGRAAAPLQSLELEKPPARDGFGDLVAEFMRVQIIRTRLQANRIKGFRRYPGQVLNSTRHFMQRLCGACPEFIGGCVKVLCAMGYKTSSYKNRG